MDPQEKPALFLWALVILLHWRGGDSRLILLLGGPLGNRQLGGWGKELPHRRL